MSSQTSRAKSYREPPSTISIRAEFEALLSEDSENEESSTIEEQQEAISSQGQAQRGNSFIRIGRSNTSEDRDEIVLSIIWSDGRIGAAYYNVLTSELFVMEDVNEDRINFAVTRAIYSQCKPRYVVTTTNASTAFVTAVKKLALAEQFTEDGSMVSTSNDGTYTAALKLMSKKDCGYERCFHRVRCLRLQNEPPEATNEERLIFLNSILDFKSHAMIHALGALLIFLDAHWCNIALEPSGKATFLCLRFVNLKDLVVMSGDSYRALNIVQTRQHPSFFKFGNSITKTQRVSLFAFLNRCQSRPGTQFLWKMLQHPTRNIATLNRRLDAIQFFLEPSNQSIVENLLACLKHVYRLTNVTLSRCSGPQARASDWHKLYKTLSHLIYIADVCGGHEEKVELFGKIARSITDEVQHVKYFIEYIVDFEASRRENDFVVKANVDPLLDELIHTRSTLPQLLTQMGEKDMQENLPPCVSKCSMLYLPNIGYVVAVTEWNTIPPENTIFPGLEFKFTIDGTRYYKTPCARELDSNLGDIVLQITKRRSRIMLKLVRYIRKQSETILTAIELCAELDTLLAFAAVARDHNYVRPKVVESQVIAIEEGRHPLQEFLIDYVPNNTYSGDGKSLLKILTGPNTCGKSLYLKQVGLLVFMAHIGCYVPAKSATIGVVTHILSQILTTDSVALEASTFLQSLRQINSALSCSTPNSLVIIDEFGKGTSEISGLSLLAAVLENFLERGESCPHIFVATHIHRVIALLPQSPLVETQTFEYVPNDDGSLAFLYRLTSGNATGSYAHSVAKAAGLDEKIVNRSLEVYEAFKQGKLPSPLPEVQQRQRTAKHIVEQILTKEHIDLDELKSWVRQAILPAVRRN